jgi:hypothetical protein
MKNMARLVILFKGLHDFFVDTNSILATPIMATDKGRLTAHVSP